MKFEPIGDRVVIKTDRRKERQIGSIVIPKQSQEIPSTGVIVECGPGIFINGERIPMQVKVGDKVLFGKLAGHIINVDDQDFAVMREEEVFVILRD